MACTACGQLNIFKHPSTISCNLDTAATAFANGKEQILTTYRTDNFNQLPLVCDYIAVPNLVQNP